MYPLMPSSEGFQQRLSDQENSNVKIAIIGTRGIPNYYGGFEQFAQYLAQGLVERGHDITVYNPIDHPFKEETFGGIKIVRKWHPENKIGSFSNFIYDYLCLKDALGKGFDIIYEAGYGTNAPSHLLLNIDRSVIMTNMDGLEWKRAKWNYLTKMLMKYFERLTVKTSHCLVSDNVGIQAYIKNKFGRDSRFLAYGADPVGQCPVEPLAQYGVTPQGYFLVIARIEPENNIEVIINGYLKSSSTLPILIVGSKSTRFFGKLAAKLPDDNNIRFVGGIYDKPALDTLRQHALIYLHGHSVGGTNPSLLEAMASGAFISAHENEFNRSVLEDNALFFSNEEVLAGHFRDIARWREIGRAHV